MSDATCESKSHTLEGITGLQKKKKAVFAGQLGLLAGICMSSTRGAITEPRRIQADSTKKRNLSH